nr:retrotransposon protein, putative, unclassified [Tanacetum cinerariifolium]
MRKIMLKQEFSEFRVSKEEGLHKGYDRFQKILSQLNQMQAKPDNDDVNLKFLRALPYSWSQLRHFERECNVKKVNEKAWYSAFKISEVKTEEPKATVSIDSMLNWNEHEVEHKPEEGEQVYDPAINAVGSVYDAAAEFAMMEISSKLGLGFKEYFGSDEVFDLSTPSIFDPKPVTRKVKSLYERFVKAGDTHEVSPSITGTFMPASFQSVLKETQVTFASVPAGSRNSLASTSAGRSIPAASRNRSASIHAGRSIPAASKNRSASIHAGRSIPAASRNRSASIHAGRSIHAASRNRPASIHADKHIPTGRSNKPTPFPAGRTVPTGWINHAARTFFGLTNLCFDNVYWPGIYNHMSINEGRWGSAVKSSADIGIVDSGCSKSMTGNKDKLDDFVQVKGSTVTFGGGGEFQLPDESQVVLRIPKRHDLYTFNLSDVQPEQHINCLLAKASLEESTKWHRRMAHVNFKTINKLAKLGLVEGLPLKLFTNDHNCVACNKRKQHKASYKAISAMRTISEPLQLLHMDLFGPTSIRSIDHKYYSLVITDDFSRFCWAFFLGTKDETFYILKDFIALIQNQLNKKVKAIRYDNETEFQNAKLIALCREKGIKRDYKELARLQRQEYEAHSAAVKHGFDFSVDTTALLPQANIEISRNLVPATGDPAGGIVPTGGVPADSDPASSVPTGRVLVGCSIPASSVPAGGDLVGSSVPTSDVPSSSFPARRVPAGGVLAGSLVSTDSGASSVPAVSVLVHAIVSTDSAASSPLPPVHSLGSYSNVVVDPIAARRINSIHPQSHILGDLQSPVQTRSTMQKSKFGENAFISYAQNHNKTNHADHLHCLFACFLSQLEPSSVANALADPDWVAAMQEEMQQFYHQQVWKLVPLPAEKIAINTKWILKNMRDARGIVVRNKARLVAQGHRQAEGIDYDEVFAQVARIEAIQLFLAFASYMGFMVYQVDVKSAFLYGEIEEEVYVTQPKGFEDPYNPKHVYRVVKALYGLHQAPKVCQDKYVKDMLKKFDMESVRTATTPYEVPKHKSKDEPDDNVNVHLFQSMIGSLMYLTASRPDIMFAVSACSRHQVSPLTSHLNVVKKIFKYLKGQPNLSLWYPRDSPFQLEAYSDSDYDESHGDRKSTTGGCQFLGRRLISWQCKKQTVVATSSTEAEYVAAASCCGQVLWIQNQMLDYGFNFMHTRIFIDNHSTICIVKNVVFHQRTKHIEIRHHFIRDAYEKNLIQVVKIHTDENVADLLTKAFDGPRFHYLIVHIGMLNP